MLLFLLILVLGIIQGNLAGNEIANRKKEDVVVFVYSGNGAQYKSMAQELFRREPVFRLAVEECDRIAARQRILPYKIIESIYYSPTLPSASSPLLFVIEYALTRLLQSRGVEPDIVIGASLGELTCGVITGLYSLEIGLQFVATRVTISSKIPPSDGAMIVVLTTEAKVIDAINTLKSEGNRLARMAIGAVNGPENVILSGGRSEVEMVINKLREYQSDLKTYDLNSGAGYHSPLMNPSVKEVRKLVKDLRFNRPYKTPVWISTVTGTEISENVLGQDYWEAHLCGPIRFYAAMLEAHQKFNASIFVEVGPKIQMSRLAAQNLKKSTGVTVLNVMNPDDKTIGEIELFTKVARQLQLTGNDDEQPRKSMQDAVVFIYTGNGAQYKSMGRELYEREAVFRSYVDECDRIAARQGILPYRIADSIYNLPDVPFPKYSAPLLFVIEYALTRLLQSCGIEPDIVIGASLGELTCGVVTGLYSLEVGLQFVSLRAVELSKLPESDGVMMIAGVTEQKALKAIDDLIAKGNRLSRVSIGAVSTPKDVILSGERSEVQMVINYLLASQADLTTYDLNAGNGYHSPLMNPAAQEIRKFVEDLHFNRPSKRPIWISTVTGQQVSMDAAEPGYWEAHLCGTVRFHAALLVARQQFNGTIFVEVGPKVRLTGLIPENLQDWDKLTIVNVMNPQDTRGDLVVYNEAVGKLKKKFPLSYCFNMRSNTSRPQYWVCAICCFCSVFWLFGF